MNGIEMQHRGGLVFHIEQQRIMDRYPTLNLVANPLLWWVTVRDRDTFGDDEPHSVTGGTRTKQEAESEIDKYLADKARDAYLRRVREARS